MTRRSGVPAWCVCSIWMNCFQLPKHSDIMQSSHGHRLAIVSNGGGLGVLAVDRLIDLGGELASISEDVRKALAEILPEQWSNANPVDILGDADGERYAQACEQILGDTANNALLIMNSPNTLASPIENAKSVVERRPQTPQRDLLPQTGLRGMDRR